MILADPRLKVTDVAPAPRQTKLLGALYEGVGTITAVAVELRWCFCLITDEKGFEHHAFLADLDKARVTFPTEPQPYREVHRRVGYGLFNSMYELESVHHSDLTHVEQFEAQAA